MADYFKRIEMANGLSCVDFDSEEDDELNSFVPNVKPYLIKICRKDRPFVFSCSLRSTLFSCADELPRPKCIAKFAFEGEQSSGSDGENASKNKRTFFDSRVSTLFQVIQSVQIYSIFIWFQQNLFQLLY